jgi:hypothetical protein
MPIIGVLMKPIWLFPKKLRDHALGPPISCHHGKPPGFAGELPQFASLLSCSGRPDDQPGHLDYWR